VCDWYWKSGGFLARIEKQKWERVKHTRFVLENPEGISLLKDLYGNNLLVSAF